MSNKEPGYVYILTNPSFREDWVKIGKSSRPVDVRSKELDNTAVPLPFEIYATMKTVKYNEKERTGTWLSEQMGHSISTVSRWMTNKVQSSVEQLYEIARHLDVDVKEYMDQSSLIRQFGNKIWYFYFNIVYLHSKMNQ